MFEQLCAELPWAQRLCEVWRMRDPDERDASLALRAGARQPAAQSGAAGIAPTTGCTPVTRSRWPPTRCSAYLTDPQPGKDALLICDTWEMADALNRRLHDTLTDAGPTRKAARDHDIRVGDIIMSRNNDVTIDVRPGAGHRDDRVDQVRNGNRWRVAGIDPETNRIAAERLTDKARVVFENDYLTRARHPGLRRDRALRAGRHRRQLVRAFSVEGSRQPGHGLRGDDPRPATPTTPTSTNSSAAKPITNTPHP